MSWRAALRRRKKAAPSSPRPGSCFSNWWACRWHARVAASSCSWAAAAPSLREVRSGCSRVSMACTVSSDRSASRLTRWIRSASCTLCRASPSAPSDPQALVRQLPSAMAPGPMNFLNLDGPASRFLAGSLRGACPAGPAPDSTRVRRFEAADSSSQYLHSGQAPGTQWTCLASPADAPATGAPPPPPRGARIAGRPGRRRSRGSRSRSRVSLPCALASIITSSRGRRTHDP